MCYAGQSSPAKQGVKRERSKTEARRQTQVIKLGIQNLPLPAGIEAAIRQNPGLVSGYIESKVAHEQRLQKHLSDLPHLLPVCDQILRDRKLKLEQQQQHFGDTIRMSPVPLASPSLPPNKKARHAEAEPSHDVPAVASHTETHRGDKANATASIRGLLRMESGTGSSGAPTMGLLSMPAAYATHAKATVSMPTCLLPELTANKHNTPQHLAKLASLNSGVASQSPEVQSCGLEGPGDSDSAALPPLGTGRAPAVVDAQLKPAPPVWGQDSLTAVRTKQDTATAVAADHKSVKKRPASGDQGSQGQDVSPTAIPPLLVKSTKTSRCAAVDIDACMQFKGLSFCCESRCLASEHSDELKHAVCMCNA